MNWKEKQNNPNIHFLYFAFISDVELFIYVFDNTNKTINSFPTLSIRHYADVHARTHTAITDTEHTDLVINRNTDSADSLD